MCVSSPGPQEKARNADFQCRYGCIICRVVAHAFSLKRELINGLGPTSAPVSASGFEAAFVRISHHVAEGPEAEVVLRQHWLARILPNGHHCHSINLETGHPVDVGSNDGERQKDERYVL